MPLFDLPTSASKPDSHAAAYRMDEVNPVSSVSPTGGGSVTFEMSSPAGNWFVPKLSYFEFRLKVVQTSDSAALTAAQGADSSLAAQFAEYPASHIVETFAHSVNGASLETVSDCAELSAIQSRTAFPKDYADTFSGTFRTRSAALGGNSATTVPSATSVLGSPLQPWDGTIKTWSCKYVPPAALFSYDGSIPGLRQRMVLTLTNDLYKAVLAKDSSSQTFTVTLDSIRFYAAHVVPEAPIAPPRTVVLSLPTMSMQKNTISSTNQTLVYSVAPSTDKIFVAQNVAAATGIIGTAAHEFVGDNIDSIELNYAGQRAPSISYGNQLASDNVNRDAMRAYLDFAATTGRLYRSQGIVDDEFAWTTSPIFGAEFQKPPNDQSTNLIVRATFAAPGGNLCVASRSHKIIVISYNADGLAETVDVQEDLS